jgi:hypothetical protein
LQFLEPVLVKGLPGEEAFKALDSLAKDIYTANQAMDKTGVAE